MRRAFVKEAAEKFGDQCIVVAIDAKKVSKPGEPDRWEIFTHGGRNPTGLDAVDYAREVVSLGAGEILLTSMDRDGTKSGFDIALTRAVADAVPVPVIASGGVGNLDHWSRASATATPPRCWRPRSFISASSPCARPRTTWRRPACRCGSILKPTVRCAPAQASACSSRSLPQNNSPSAVVKLGAPKTPSCCASSVCARRRELDVVGLGGFERGVGVDIQAATGSRRACAASSIRPSSIEFCAR